MLNGWTKVLATHMEMQTLSTGMWPGDCFPGVALPDVKALRKWVALRYLNSFTCAQVVDCGPWAIDDSEYVFGQSRPRAEQMLGMRCPRSKLDPNTCATVSGVEIPRSNGAGIDLMPGAARLLGIAKDHNVEIEWCFIYASTFS